MSDIEPFTLVEESSSLSKAFVDRNSAKSADHDVQYMAHLRKQYLEMTVTATPVQNCHLVEFAAAGHATIELQATAEDPMFAWRGWVPALRQDERGSMGQTVFFAKYHYTWAGEDFIVYVIGGVQYILKEPRGSETNLSSSHAVDSLIAAASTWKFSNLKIVWVFDQYWQQSKELFQQVEKAKWENVILDPKQKSTLQDVSNKFFDSQDVYEDLGVPWKRGIIFHGPPGNGKTISVKALMHTLYDRELKIPSLYVKSATQTNHIRNVFQFARRLAPCLLIFEDIDTIVTQATRSYFFNEVDGLESNDGILMIASTNHLDQLDPGLRSRPSRFDRKYYFPLPNEQERAQYAEFWRTKLQKKKNKVEFPSRLCPAMAKITGGFSFAYLQEAFVATLLVLARDAEDEDDGESSDIEGRDDRSASRDDLDDYRLWRVFKAQVKNLSDEMGDDTTATIDSTAIVGRSDLIKQGSEPTKRLLRKSPVLKEKESASEPLPIEGIDRRFKLDIRAQGSAGVKRQFINTAAFEYA